jgi:hypothetical protein
LIQYERGVQAINPKIPNLEILPETENEGYQHVEHVEGIKSNT